MASYSSRLLILCTVLLLTFVYIQTTEQATISAPSDEDDSSSAQSDCATSNSFDEASEEQQPQKRSTDDTENNNNASPRLSIPGLPDPATILKIVEVLQTVSEQVIPILVEGINAPAELVTERLNKDFMMLKKLKSRLDLFGGKN